MWNPLFWVMEMAALVAIVVSNGKGMPPDQEDCTGIVYLLFANSLIGLYEERDPVNAVKAVIDSLAPKALVKRDGAWKEIKSADLVPGDMVAFKIALRLFTSRSIRPHLMVNRSPRVGNQCFS